jgi:hypothetical protein
MLLGVMAVLVAASGHFQLYGNIQQVQESRKALGCQTLLIFPVLT